MKPVCLAVLNYNGIGHLRHLLPTALEAARACSGECSLLVLDNSSTEPDVAWIASAFPTVEVVPAPRNDFLFSYNWLAGNRREDILVFLNNDLRLQPGFVDPLIRHFSHDDVFAVSATSRDWDDTAFTCGPARLKSHHGFYIWDYQRESQHLSHTLFTSGGFMAVDRRKFLELDGFNRLYWPAYAEDLDLCFRAWRRGWRCIFEPRSVALHRENGSWGVTEGAARLQLRAQLLFQWASLPPAAPWLERTAFLLLTACRKSAAGQPWWLKVWLSTRREWQRSRRQCAGMATPPGELADIMARIAAPV